MRDSRFVLTFATAFLLAGADLRADSAWTIPGIVSAAGLNNTRFVSDFTVTNPGAAPAQVTISFFPSASANPKSVTLSPGETIAYRNVVETLFGTTGAGALSISSDQPLLLRARTYNTAPTGNYGVALPVYANDRLLATGETGDSLWISQDASGTSGYRTNIAVVFPDETGGTATVTVFDADGNERGSKDFSLDSGGFQQFSVGSFAGAVSVGRAMVHVTRGRAAGYSVVVDNVTGDSSLFTFEDLPGGRQDVLLNGVARANGRNGTFFRTDGRFYNPTDTDATVRVAFHANGDSNPAPATASFTLPAGKIRDVVDVLDAMLGLPVGSSGALRFTSDWPVAVLCRTSNVDPTGARPGSFGAQQKPVQILSFLTSADEGASITGIRQDASYRTNVGFAAGEDGARYTLTLTTAVGTTVATTSTSLGPRGWKQPNVQDLFPGISIPPGATLRIRVTEGSLDAFDSSIDNASGDSVVTPVAALPVAIPSSATIGPQGGSIQSADGRLTLKIPAGALSQPTTLSFQTTTNDAPQGTGPAYQLSPPGVTFARPALMTLAYARADTESSSAEALTLAVTSGGGWYAVGGGALDSARHTMTVPFASTSPTLSTSPASRAPLASGATYWAIVLSWEFIPRGKRAVVTDGRLEFLVKVTGGSSATSSGGFALVSSTPAEVDVTWYVNGVEMGDLANGAMVRNGKIGIYVAPRCPPARNPVKVYAVISNRGFPSIPYQPTGSAWVRVLPKDWTFKVIQESSFVCPTARAADHARWTAGFAFSLDDMLNTTRPVPAAQVVEFFGAPTACESYEAEFKRRGDPLLDATLRDGFWDEKEDLFRIVVDFHCPTSLGYDYVTLGNDGKKIPGHIDPGPVVALPDMEIDTPETQLRTILPTGAGAFALTVELKHVASGGCP